MVARFQRFHARPAFDHDARAFMAQDRGEHAFWVGARQGEFVSMANAGRLDLNQNFTFAWSVEIDLGHFKWAASLCGHCGAGFHLFSPHGMIFV